MNKRMKWILGVIGVICILGVVAGFIIDKLGPTLEEEEEEVAPTAEIETESTPVEETETPSAPQTIEELFSDADNAEISEDNGEMKVVVTYSEYITDKGLRDNMYERIRTTLGLRPDIDALNFQLKVPLKDAAGNVEENVVMSYQLYEDKLAEINFDNLGGVDIPAIANILYLHPSFKD